MIERQLEERTPSPANPNVEGRRPEHLGKRFFREEILQVVTINICLFFTGRALGERVRTIY
jgi:hypothetical protein